MEHCEEHSGNMERIRSMEQRMTELEEARIEMMRLYASINANVASINTKMSVQCTTLATMSNTIDKLLATCEELAKFKWFRDWANGIKDNLPKVVVYVILGVLIILAMLHNIDIWAILKKKIMGA